MLKIMVVDDSKATRLIVKKILLEYDKSLTIYEAVDGIDAVEKAILYHPDIIILDINMPRMRGDQALLQLRKNSLTKDIDVVVLTTETEKQLIIKLLKLGIKQYVVKPFKKEVFLQKMEVVFGSVRKLQFMKGGEFYVPVKRQVPLEKLKLVLLYFKNFALLENIVKILSLKWDFRYIVVKNIKEMREFVEEYKPYLVLVEVDRVDLDYIKLAKDIKFKRVLLFTVAILTFPHKTISSSFKEVYDEVFSYPFYQGAKDFLLRIAALEDNRRLKKENDKDEKIK